MAEAYGIDKVTILVLDDSDDDTILRVDEVVEEYRKQHFQIEVLRRGKARFGLHLVLEYGVERDAAGRPSGLLQEQAQALVGALVYIAVGSGLVYRLNIDLTTMEYSLTCETNPLTAPPRNATFSAGPTPF